MSAPADVQAEIAAVCDELKEMLIAKNKAYGNSALDPVRIFSKADAEEQILVRLDDKLSRIARGEALGEDVIKDILGYLVLLRVGRRLRLVSPFSPFSPRPESVTFLTVADDFPVGHA